MRAYLDCPGCSCLVGVGESACPFCGHTLRSGHAPGWLGLGLVLALGSGTISCTEKGGDDTDTATTQNVTDTAQGPASNGVVTDDDGNGDGATYGGPDETSSTVPYTSTTEPGTTSGSSSTGPDTTTTNDPSNGDGSTYGGPDEGTTTDDPPESSSSSSESSSTSLDPDTDSNGDGSTYGGPDSETL